MHYKRVKLPPGHPLLTPNGTATYLHRVVLWKKIGPGSHPCHHCGRIVTWAPGRGVRDGALVVDHLDDNRQNNDPTNLIPSCHACNKGRTPKKNRVRDDELWLSRSDADTRRRALRFTCAECGEEFLAPHRRVRPQKFCGRVCSSRNGRRATLLRKGSGANSKTIRDNELFVTVGGKYRTRAIVKNCEVCGSEYLAVKSEAAKRRTCSKACRLKILHAGNRKSA